MHNFKTGDLALIIQHKSIPYNVGKCVQLIKKLMPGESMEFRGRHFINRHASAFWLVEGDVLSNANEDHFGVGGALEKNLIPLRGDFKPEENDLAEYADTSFYDLRTGRQRLVGGRA